VTYHPTTLSSNSVESEIDCLLSALDQVKATLVITYPNADAGNRIIIDKYKYFLASHKNAFLHQSLGQQKYYSLMALADLLIGNSSSGIWEAPSFKLPAVNLGDRQRGRKRAGNVLDVGISVDEIARAIQTGLSPGFRNSLKNITNPYGDGQASVRIVEKLKHTILDSALLQKKFVDLSVPRREALNG
jgi:UDP-hydrolysing UDP-N-acetyl-D-glucosamine 2-epimerase